MHKIIVDRLLAYHKNNQIKIDFDEDLRIFRFKSCLMSQDISESVKNYIRARKGFTFSPHQSYYEIERGSIFLIQEIPFDLGFQETMRAQVDIFLDMSKSCRRMLCEICAEELDISFLR